MQGDRFTDDEPQAFTPRRADLYTAEELYAGFSHGGWDTTLDARIASDYANAGERRVLDHALHDASITIALDEFVDDREIVGIMGGHRLHRGSDAFSEIVELGTLLTAAGFTVTTGGGPGAMEAANFGAWLSAFDNNTRSHFRELLARAPHVEDDRDASIAAALDIRAAALHPGAENLGIPTWVYWHEPANVFATAIAKYFNNSIREHGLLGLATSGVIFTEGGPGTWQEILTDAAQNSYLTEGVRSPMVFLRYRHADLELVYRQAATFGWSDLVYEVADVEGALEALTAHRSERPRERNIQHPRRQRR